MDENKEKQIWIDRHFGKIVAVLIVLLALSVWLYSETTKPETNVIENLSDEINDHKWVLYTTSYCPACIEQKKILGEHADKIIIVTCDSSDHSLELCTTEGIRAVPTWVNIKTGMHIEGYQTLEDIEVMLNE